jgi:hypothetical protein
VGLDRIWLAGGACERHSGLGGDLERRRLWAHTNATYNGTIHVTAAADDRQQNAWLGVFVGTQIHSEDDRTTTAPIGIACCGPFAIAWHKAWLKRLLAVALKRLSVAAYALDLCGLSSGT